MAKIEDIVAALQKRENEKNKTTLLWILAIIGAIAAVAGIAYAVYRYLAPDYLEDFEDDFDDDFEDFFEDDDFPEVKEEKAPQVEPVEEEAEDAVVAEEE